MKADEQDARWNLRMKGALAKRFIAACQKCGMDETTAFRALAEAFAKRVEHDGGVWLPLDVVGHGHAKTPSFTSTVASAPSRVASLNEEPPASASVQPEPAQPRMTKTRQALRAVAIKAKK